MIAVDTNVLLRYLVEDDLRQSELARMFFEERLNAANPGWISLLVIAETAWALRSIFGADPAMVRQMARDLLAAAQLVVEAPDLVRDAIALETPDIADAIIHLGGRDAGCTSTVTFDRRFARVPGVELLG